jgi:hypothetical protein
MWGKCFSVLGIAPGGHYNLFVGAVLHMQKPLHHTLTTLPTNPIFWGEYGRYIRNYIELVCPITIACDKVWKTNIEHESLSQEQTNELVQTKKPLNAQFEHIECLNSSPQETFTLLIAKQEPFFVKDIENASQ